MKHFVITFDILCLRITTNEHSNWSIGREDPFDQPCILELILIQSVQSIIFFY